MMNSSDEAEFDEPSKPEFTNYADTDTIAIPG